MQAKGDNNEFEMPNKIMNGKIIQKPEIKIRDRATEATSQSLGNESTIGGKTPNLPKLRRYL